MCDPVSIGSAVVMGLGTVMQMKSQANAQKKMDSVLQRNAEEADRLQKDSSAKTLNAAQEFGREKFDANAQQETVKSKQEFMASQSAGVLPGEYYGESAGENVKRYQETKSKKASNYTDRMADALAAIRGFEGGMRAGQTKTRDAAEQVVLNNNSIAGNNAILPIQLEAAKASGSNPLADIMTGVGSAGLSAGLSSSAGGINNLFGGGKAIGGKAIANPNIAGTKYLLA